MLLRKATFLIALLSPMILFSQKIAPVKPVLHAYLFSNTSDIKIGMSCYKDFTNMESQVKIISDAIGYESDITSYVGLNFDTTNLYKIRNSAVVKDSDVMILYFSSHGGRSTSDTSEFPDVVFPGRSTVLVNAESIHNEFKTKFHPKLLITIIDACNDTVANLSQSQIVYFKDSYEHEFPKNLHLNEALFYKRLFKNSYGDIILCSSQKGKTSFTNSLGSILTNELIRSWEMLSKRSGQVEILPITWESFLKCMKYQAMNKSLLISSTHYNDTTSRYPVWRCSVKTDESEFNFNVESPELLISVMRKTDQGWTMLVDGDKYTKLNFGIEPRGSLVEAITDKFKSVTYYIYDRLTKAETIKTGKPEDRYSVTYDTVNPFLVCATIEYKNGEKMDVAIVQ